MKNLWQPKKPGRRHRGLHPLKRLEELGQRHAQRRDQAMKRREADVAFAALDAADVVPVQLGPSREFLLRDLRGLTKLANASAHELWQCGPHGGIVAPCTLSCYTL